MAEKSAYAPIDSYGLIGDTRTAALVGRDGSIDWLCLPQFDSPSVFGALLDAERGGRFVLRPAEEVINVSQYYKPDTNVLVTRWKTESGVIEVIDFMPVSLSKHDHHLPDLVRLVRAVYGTIRLKLHCRPAFDYARGSHTIAQVQDGAVFESEGLRLALLANVPLTISGDEVVGDVEVKPDRPVAVAFDQSQPEGVEDRRWTIGEAEDLLSDTCGYWRKWISSCTYHGRWEEPVRRSALTLKMLTHADSGAVVAAPTCSLPEHIGGTRNWDYRFSWLRDAAFTVYALLQIGFRHEAAAFMEFLRLKLGELEDGDSLQPVYPIGGHSMEEQEIDSLEGYKGSAPVRVGNEAAKQFQLDVCGALLDAAYLLDQGGDPLSHDMWNELRRLLNRLVGTWREPDDGIWEVRGGPRQFTHSKVMCWVAFDRGVRLAERRGRPGEVEEWRRQADMAYELVMSEGWNSEIGAFVQTLGGDKLDASALMMPLVHMLPHGDPRMISTIRAMRRPISEGGLLSDFMLHRYDPERVTDGLGEPEGAFNLCSFWLCEAMARAGNSDPALVDESRELLELMLARSGPLCLYPEQVGPDGEALGNYPQGLTHLSLISAVTAVDHVLNRRG